MDWNSWNIVLRNKVAYLHQYSHNIVKEDYLATKEGADASMLTIVTQRQTQTRKKENILRHIHFLLQWVQLLSCL